MVPRRHARRPAAVLMIVMALAGCTTATRGSGRPAGTSASTSSSAPSPSPTTSGQPSQAISFRDCSGSLNLDATGIPQQRLSKLTFECGRLQVPLDYDDPTGVTTSIEMIKIHYKEQVDRIGSLLLDPGGPGGSGVFLSFSLAASMSEDVLRRFDLVGFDPRGVGLSSPVSCIGDDLKDSTTALNPDVRTAAGLALAKRINTQVATACSDKYGPSLAHFNTVETVRDMDRIRAGLLDTKLNYLGFSYGTVLGSVYAHMFPQNVGVAVLDGAVDPTLAHRPIESLSAQIGGFEDAFDQFAADCVTRASCKALGSPRATATALVKRADAAHIPSSRPGEKRTATGGNVLLAVVSALYSKSSWDQLGAALVDAQRGDSAGILALDDLYNERGPDGHFTNILDLFTTVTCNDQSAAEDPTDAQVKATAAQWATKYPLFGLWQAASLYMCAGWQADRHPLPARTAPGSAPILVVGNLHDPATPYTGAVNMVKAVGASAHLLTWDGEGHTSYGQSPCVDAAVNAYLIAGTVPAAGTKCPR